MTDTYSTQRVILASSNKGKIVELQSLLDGIAEVVSAHELQVTLPEETGTTFAENALLKAEAAFVQTGLTSLADDSGLEVDALQGAPGVYSARYAGESASDSDNNTKLLHALSNVSNEHRTARFRSAIAIVTAEGEKFVFEGTCEGSVGTHTRGEGGFGYDPLFVLPDGSTMAELSAAAKNAISHRGEAMRKAIPELRTYLESKAASR